MPSDTLADPRAIFFFGILAVQALFTGVLVWLVVRRYPARVSLYRFLAPAGVPLLMFVAVSLSFLTLRDREGLPLGVDEAGALGRFFLAYFVLWLVGVVFASMVIRWTRR